MIDEAVQKSPETAYVYSILSASLGNCVDNILHHQSMKSLKDILMKLPLLDKMTSLSYWLAYGPFVHQ